MAGNREWAVGEVLGDKHREHHNDLGYIEEGTGSPEGVLAAPVGSLFLRTDGGSGTTLYIKESGTGNTGWVASAAPVTDHGALTGLADDDHPQYATNTEFDDHSARHENGGADEISLAGLDGTPTAVSDHLADTADAHDASAISILDTAGDFTATDVEGALAEIQADNEAHVAAADPHTGYVPETIIDAVGDLIVGAAADTPSRLAKGTTGQHLITDTGETLDLKWESQTITIGAVFTSLTVGDYILWRVPFACTVTAVRGYVDTGTTTQINAKKVGTGDFCSADITIDPADAWEAGTVNQNTALSAGDTVAVEIVAVGTATQLTIQVEVTRP